MIYFFKHDLRAIITCLLHSVMISVNSKLPLLSTLNQDLISSDLLQNAFQVLVNRVADVKAVDDDGQTPLHKACRNGHLEIVKATQLLQLKKLHLP